ncbi:hypothetical protein Droror1_Dr00001314 [Drosera rotundifolia]
MVYPVELVRNYRQLAVVESSCSSAAYWILLRLHDASATLCDGLISGAASEYHLGESRYMTIPVKFDLSILFEFLSLSVAAMRPLIAELQILTILVFLTVSL